MNLHSVAQILGGTVIKGAKGHYVQAPGPTSSRDAARQPAAAAAAPMRSRLPRATPLLRPVIQSGARVDQPVRASPGSAPARRRRPAGGRISPRTARAANRYRSSTSP